MEKQQEQVKLAEPRCSLTGLHRLVARLLRRLVALLLVAVFVAAASAGGGAACANWTVCQQPRDMLINKPRPSNRRATSKRDEDSRPSKCAPKLLYLSFARDRLSRPVLSREPQQGDHLTQLVQKAPCLAPPPVARGPA